jgi:hypothetical protein
MKNELRLNNWVLFENRPFQIALISDYEPGLNTIEFGPGVVGWKDLTGVPLTEEILLKNGFTLNENGIPEIKSRLFLHPLSISVSKLNPSSIGFAWMDNGNTGYTVIAKHIKTVHLLQNLWKSLTNQDLNITL